MPAIGVGKELGDTLLVLVTQDLVAGSHCPRPHAPTELNTEMC